MLEKQLPFGFAFNEVFQGEVIFFLIAVFTSRRQIANTVTPALAFRLDMVDLKGNALNTAIGAASLTFFQEVLSNRVFEQLADTLCPGFLGSASFGYQTEMFRQLW